MTKAMEANTVKPRKVMAVSSGGGHWIQLMRLQEAFEGHQVTWLTVMSAEQASAFNLTGRYMNIPDATRWNKFKLVWLFVRLVYCITRVRPHVIITTGAAPGYIAITIGRMCGLKTCWIDSMANVEMLSLSGLKAEKWSDLWLTQWKHLEQRHGAQYAGGLFPELTGESSADPAHQGKEGYSVS